MTRKPLSPKAEHLIRASGLSVMPVGRIGWRIYGKGIDLLTSSPELIVPRDLERPAYFDPW